MVSGNFYFLQFVEIGVYQFLAERGRDIRFCLPEEGGYVILRRAFASALKINEVGLAVFDHHIAALEIAVEERPLRWKTALL